MKNFLNNKFNLIIILLVAIILGFGSNVFADYDFIYNNNNVVLPTLPDNNNITPNCDNILILKPANTGYQYLIIGFINTNVVDYNYYINTYGSDDSFRLSFTRCYSYNSSTNSWASEGAAYLKYFASGSTICWSNFDVYDSNGNVVFQGAPQEVTPEIPDNPETTETPEITTTLVEQATQAEMGETLLETIKTYLIYLVIFVVSMLAIWKAVRFLRNALRTS